MDPNVHSTSFHKIAFWILPFKARWATVHAITKSWTRLSMHAQLTKQLQLVTICYFLMLHFASGQCSLVSGKMEIWLSTEYSARSKLLVSGNASESESEVAQSCLTLFDPMDCSLPCSCIHGIFQARVLEWVAISFSRGSSRPRDYTRISRIVGRGFAVWATREILWEC